MYYVAKDFCFAICACAQMLCSTDTFIYLFIYLPYKSTFSTEHYRLYLTHPVKCQLSLWEETGVPGENPRPSAEH